MALVKMAGRFLRNKKGALAIVAALQLIQVLLSLWLPSLNANIIDFGIIPGDQGYIWSTGLLMLGVSVIQISCVVGAIYFGSRTAMEMGRELRGTTFRKVQQFSATDQHKFGAPTLVTRTTNDVTQVQMVVLLTFTVMITAPLMGIGGVIMAIRQDVHLSLLLVIIVPILAAIVLSIMRALTPRSVLQQTRIDRINTLMREQLTGVRVIRAFVREASEKEKFDEGNTDLREVSLSIGMLWALLGPATQFVIGLSSAAVIWFGGHRIADGAMEVGSLTAFISYLMMIMGAVMMAGMIIMLIPRGQVSAGRLQEIHDTVPSVETPENPQPIPAGPVTFEINDAGLQYPGAEAPVLSHISMTMAPGTQVAVIGSTGSGKSSIIKLIPRLMDTTSGSVRVAGIDVKNVDPAALRDRIAYVPQKAFLFSGTVASNVAGQIRQDVPVDEDRVRLALEAAQATEFVDSLADGIYSKVESGGSNYSGGQRQRLTIARALYRCLPDKNGNRQSDLLIFDDSFSALDYKTDSVLRANLRKYVGDIAILIIAQRVSTIRQADVIHVLDDGEIVGSGTHNQLNKTNATYQEIVASQMSAEEAA